MRPVFIFQSRRNWSGVSIEALIEGGIARAFVGLAFLFEALREEDSETPAVQQRNQKLNRSASWRLGLSHF